MLNEVKHGTANSLMTEVSDHKSRLLAYFDGLGFERWSAIYGDAEVSRIRRTIRQGHARMLALAEQWICEGAGEAGTGAQVLDAGCGTGLCGPLLRPYARRLEGVDLSQGMLDRALLRGTYDELRCVELVADLQRHSGRWDLLVSADTLCYFGRLEAFAAAAAASLRPDGLLVFTVEALDEAAPEPQFKLQMHGRYSHRRGYVVEALAGAGLDAFELQPVVLREEGKKPVHGWLVCARAAAR